MPKHSTPLINSFSGGELSKLIDARVDINKYYSGCKTMENFVPLVEGGAKNMPGTYFVLPTKFSDKVSRLIPFNPSTSDSYILEFGHQYIRVFKDRGQITVDAFVYPESENLTLVSVPTSDILAQWAPSTGGDNYALVDEQPTPDDGDYVSASALTIKRDTYGASFNIPLGSTVSKVSLRIRAKVNFTDTARRITPSLRVEAVNYDGAYFVPTTSYVNYDTDWVVNPNTGLEWTLEDINGLSASRLQGFGYLSGNQSRVLYISQCYVTVYYKTPAIEDFNPYVNYYESEYIKLGPYLTLGFSGNKFLYVSAKWKQPDATGISVKVATNATDNMVVSATGAEITISLANTTASKNSAVAINYKLQKLGTVNGVDVTKWTVTENVEYAAARPISATIAAATLNANEEVYQAVRNITLTTFDTKSITGITNANPAVVTSVGHSLPNGTVIYIAGVVGMTELNGNLYITANVAVDTFQLEGIDSSAYGVYVSGGYAQQFPHSSNYFPPFSLTYWREIPLIEPVEIVTPYLESDLRQLKKATSNDVMYLFHPDYPPAKLIRYSHVQWEYKVCEFIGTENIQRQGVLGFAKSITFISKANPGVVTCREHGFQHGDRVYINHVLGMLEVNGNIYTVANPTTHNFQLEGINTTGWTTFYIDPSGVKNGTAIKVVDLFIQTGDYPSCGTFHKQRLALGGFRNKPLTLKLSNIAEYERFISDSLSPDGAIEYSIVSENVDRIRWIAGLEGFVCGTTGGVWMIGASSPGEPFSQTNVDTKRAVPIGVANIEAKMSTEALMWLTRAGTSLRLFMYNLQEERWTAPDMMRIADHIAIGATEDLSGIIEMDFQQEPYPILWGVRKDGQLLGMTLNTQEQVYGWFRVVTDGEIESVCVSMQDNREDEVWIIVKRKIDEVIKRYVEYFMPHKIFGKIEDSFFVHSGLSYDGVLRSNFDNLDHLEKKYVSILADGQVHGTKMVVDGEITLDYSASKVHIGLPYTSTLIPMAMHTGSNLGTSKGKKQKIHRLTIPFYESVGGKYGPDIDSLIPIPYVTSSVLHTEDIEMEFGGDWQNKAEVCIVQDTPLPMTVLAVIPRLTLEEQ